MMISEIKDNRIMTDNIKMIVFNRVRRRLFVTKLILSIVLTVALLLIGMSESFAATLTLHPSGADTDNTVTSYTGGTAATVYDANDGDTSTGDSPGSSNDYYLDLDDHTSENGAINSVIVRSYVRKSTAWGALDASFTIGVKTNGSSDFSGSKTSSSTSYTLFSGNTYNTNPQSGSAWTWSEIDSLVAIIDHTDANGMWATELYVDIDYTPCSDPDPSTITIPGSQTIKGDPFDVSSMYNTTSDVGSFEHKVTHLGVAEPYDWGKFDAGPSTTNVNWVRVANGNAPSSSGMNLKAVSIYVGANHADQVRLAVYTGGSLSTGPAGATLLYDFGVTSGSAINQWLTLTYSGPDIEVPADDPVWIAYKSNSDGAGFDVRYSTSATGTDFQTARGRWQSASVSADDVTAYPGTWPADSGSFSSFWYSVYISYEMSGTAVCTDWTSGSSIPASTSGGSNCADFTDGGTYTLDVRGTDPDCSDSVTTTATDFTWNACAANAANDLSEIILESYRVVLNWTTECSDNEYYKVYRGGSFLADVNPCDGSYEDTTVSADTDYSFTVRGYSTDEPCESGDSNQVDVHTPVYQVMTTPGSAAGSPSNTSIYVSARYTDDSNEDNTLLIEWGLDGVDFSLGSQAISHDSSPYMYQISGLTNGTAYQVRVTYQDSDGFTGGSDVQILSHIVPAVWSDDAMLHNSNRFPGTAKWGGDWGTPTGEYGGFTCETCHDMSTTNIKRIKEAIAAPSGSFPGSEVTFENTGAGGFGDDTIGYSTSQKICEVCHSQTLYHRYSSPNIRSHESQPAIYDCTNCHSHDNGFKPDGACTVCHAISMNNRVAVVGQFSGNSHHVQGIAVDETHCYQCHWEANSDGTINQTYHGGSLNPGSTVNLVVYGSGTRPTTYTVGQTAVEYTADGSRAQILELNQVCLGCHSAQNNATQPFGDGKTPTEYSWDGMSINDRYTPESSTPWGKYTDTGSTDINPKNTQTKAFSSHGVAVVNERGWDLNETWPDTSGTVNVACYDCHNSHGSSVSGTTTSYTSATTNGGILKDTIATKGGYSMTYKPAAGGSAGNNNAHNAGAALCFDCHETANSGTTPWGYSGTYGATAPILGYNDMSRFGTGTNGPQQRYGFKASSGANKGGHFDASSALTTTVNGTINGLCTPCHDPHGVSPTLDQDYAVPMLKGTWMTSPYKEDVAPGTTNDCVGGGRNVSQWCGSSTPGYHIDQNTFDNWNFTSTASVTEPDTQFAGLCLGCHPKSSLSPDSTTTWRSVDRIHNSVKGWDTDGNTKHRYTCSKCHSPHNSALPRLLVTNCLDYSHRGRVASGGSAGSHSASDRNGGGAGQFPGGGGGDGDIPDDNNLPHFFGTNTGPYTRTCHDNTNGDGWPNNQRWNNVSQW
jgi:hypothetical protein